MRFFTERDEKLEKAAQRSADVEARIKEARAKGEYTGKQRKDLLKELDAVSVEENEAAQLPSVYKCVTCPEGANMHPLGKHTAFTLRRVTYDALMLKRDFGLNLEVDPDAEVMDWRTVEFPEDRVKGLRPAHLIFCPNCVSKFNLLEYVNG